MLWSSNLFPERKSEVNVVFASIALHSSQMFLGPRPQFSSISELRALFSFNIVPA